MNNTEKEVKIDSVSIDDIPANEEVSNNAPDTAPDIDALQAKIDELNDKYIRTVAELENTRRRAAIDADAAARNRAMNVARKILPVMDAVDAALKHSPDDAGIQSLARAMESAFAQIGIVKIDTIGQVLNPQFHNAIQVVPIAADADPQQKPNTITNEMQSGYMFGDSVLRTAMVVVCK